MDRKTIVATLIAVFLLGSVSAFGAGSDKTKVKGFIISRTGETLIVKSPGGENTTVVLTDYTVTKDNKGLLGLRKQRMSNVVLIPGLKVDVDGTSDDQGRVTAKTITVDGDDLETAEMIQAGLHPTAEQVAANTQNVAANKENIAANKQNIDTNQQNIAANKQNVDTNQQNIAANKQQIEKNVSEIEEQTNRFNQLSEYDTKGEATVHFAVGSSKISPKEMQQLKQLSQNATQLTGYIIEVKGFTDSTGSAKMNDKLSDDRAQAVVMYLIQQCGVPVRHVIAPGAMGEYGAAASNETTGGRAENRRVEVKVLVNKGIAGT